MCLLVCVCLCMSEESSLCYDSYDTLLAQHTPTCAALLHLGDAASSLLFHLQLLHFFTYSKYLRRPAERSLSMSLLMMMSLFIQFY